MLDHLTQSALIHLHLVFAACPWGNRYMDCRNADCTDPKIRDYCCETCSTLAVPEATTTLSPLSPGNVISHSTLSELTVKVVNFLPRAWSKEQKHASNWQDIITLSPLSPGNVIRHSTPFELTVKVVNLLPQKQSIFFELEVKSKNMYETNWICDMYVPEMIVSHESLSSSNTSNMERFHCQNVLMMPPGVQLYHHVIVTSVITCVAGPVSDITLDFQVRQS